MVLRIDWPLCIETAWLTGSIVQNPAYGDKMCLSGSNRHVFVDNLVHKIDYPKPCLQ